MTVNEKLSEEYGDEFTGLFLSPGDSKRGHLGYCRFTCDIKTASSNRMNNAN